jgi:hypothetical protein
VTEVTTSPAQCQPGHRTRSKCGHAMTGAAARMSRHVCATLRGTGVDRASARLEGRAHHRDRAGGGHEAQATESREAFRLAVEDAVILHAGDQARSIPPKCTLRGSEAGGHPRQGSRGPDLIEAKFAQLEARVDANSTMRSTSSTCAIPAWRTAVSPRSSRTTPPSRRRGIPQAARPATPASLGHQT